MEEVFEVKMAKFRHDLHSSFDKIMRIEVEVSQEALVAIMNGKCVEGRMRKQSSSMGMHLVIEFVPYNRKPRPREKDVLVKKLPWGWVKESVARIKVFGSFPKDVGTAQVMGLLQDHIRDAKNALIDRELIDFV